MLCLQFLKMAPYWNYTFLSLHKNILKSFPTCWKFVKWEKKDFPTQVLLFGYIPPRWYLSKADCIIHDRRSDIDSIINISSIPYSFFGLLAFWDLLTCYLHISIKRWLKIKPGYVLWKSSKYTGGFRDLLVKYSLRIYYWFFLMAQHHRSTRLAHWLFMLLKSSGAIYCWDATKILRHFYSKLNSSRCLLSQLQRHINLSW